MTDLRYSFSGFNSSNRILILDTSLNDPHSKPGNDDKVLMKDLMRNSLAVVKTPRNVIPTTCVLYGCSFGERVYDWPEKGHGAFTYYLLEGMRGKAFDAQGRLTVQGLGSHVEKQVPQWSARSGKTQTPCYEQTGSPRDICLAIRGVDTAT